MCFVFVILHYCTIGSTINCVKSIRTKFDYADYHIIIVDNASPNGSGKVLEQLYGQDKDCVVIINDHNLGFAKGNNVGFKYAKNTYDCDFICVMNSDVYLLDDHFGKMTVTEYRRKPYYVLGPNIFTPDKKQCNPMNSHVITLREAKKKLVSLKIQLLLNSINLDNISYRLALKLRRKNVTEKYERDISYENVKLHGCCWIFSRDFINEYDGLNEGTFLYLEEELLYLMMVRDKKRTVYSPDVHVYHEGDASTNNFHADKEKRRFVLENHFNSMRYIYSYLMSLGV